MMNFHHHLQLLQRWDRGLVLQEIIKEVVSSKSRVLDIGCGSGILSLFAAGAGAHQVVGIDKQDVSLAMALAAENCIDHNRIHFIQADALEIDPAGINSPFDILMSMVYYNDPRRDEKQSYLAREVQSRFLKKGGVCIPEKIEYTAYGLEWPEQDILSKVTSLRQTIKEMEGKYKGLSFNSLLEKSLESPDPLWFPERLTSGHLLRSKVSRILTKETLFATESYVEEISGYPECLVLEINSDGVFSTVLWIQKIIFRNRLIFYNESVSWVRRPMAVKSGDKIVLPIDTEWRNSNIFSKITKI